MMKPAGWLHIFALVQQYILCGSLLCAEVNSSPPTSTFRDDAQHSGVFADPSTGIYGGILWRRQTDGAIRSSPVVAGSIVLIGSCDGNLYAFNAKTGVEQWRFLAGSAVSSSATVSDNRVFISSFDGGFYALNLTDGKLIWKTHFGHDLPLAWDADSGPHPARFNGDFLLSSATVADSTVVVGSGDGGVYAFDVASGLPRWKFLTGGRVRSSPAISAHAVYVGSFDGSVYKLDLASGNQLWRFDTDGRSLNSAEFGFDRKSIVSSPAVADGTVYIGSRDGFLYAIDAESGKVKWRFDHQMSWAISSPAVRHSMIYEGSSDGHFFHVVNSADGHEKWRFITDSSIWSSPALAESTGYIGDDQGNLFAIDLTSGEERWRFLATAAITSSPSVADGVLYVGSNDGSIYALRVNSDALLKRAVFWDAESARVVVSADVQANQLAARNALSARGYEIIGSSQLAHWLSERLSDHTASVVVFANDCLPSEVVGVDPAHGLLRQYLETGGKVVWMNDPPLARSQLSHGNFEISWEQTDKLLGIAHAGALSDSSYASYDIRATPEGRSWGLQEWWLGAWDVPISGGITVLASDERGYAGAWVKRYDGPPGSGFVFISRTTWSNDDFARLAFVAEYRP
jgi:eukaryotic-like serine/threonine-protein kinase